MVEKASNVVLNFKMNGQVQYAQTLKQINMVMSTASKEYTSHVTAMGKDASATDKLIAEKKKLETQLAASAQKVQMLNKEFEEMQNDSTATADDLQKLYNQVLSAETAHAKLENSMKRVSEGLSEESIAAREAKDELKRLADDAKVLQTEQKKLTSEFELQASQLGKNATETERAELSLKQYTSQTDLAKKAIVNLEQQLDAAKRAFGENSKEVMDLETKLNGTRKELSQMESSFNDVDGGASKAGFSLDNFVGKAAGIAALATAIAAVGTAAFDVAKDFDDASAKIQMSLGLTADESEGLEQAARNIWKDGFGESLETVIDSIVRVKQNMHGLVDDANIEQITRDSMVLAETFDADVNEVVRAAFNLMNNFGVTSEEAFDMMAKGAQNGLNFSNEMFDNLAEYAPLWSDMGFDIEEMFGILETGAKEGVYNLDYLNDVMKEFQIRATDGSKSTAEAVAELGPEVQKVWDAFSNGEATVADMSQAAVAELVKIDDKVKQNELGVALFGTKWEDLGGDVVLSMLNAGTAMTEFEGTMTDMAETQDQTFGQRWTELLRTGQDALMPLGEAILNVAENVLPVLIDAISFVSESFGSFSEKVSEVFSGIQSFIQPAIDTVVTYLQEKLATIQQFWAENGEQIMQAVENAFNGIKAVIEFVMPFVQSLIEGVWEAIKNVIDGVLNTIMGLIKTFSGLLTGDFSKMWEGVKQLFSGAVEAIWGLLQLGFLGKIFKVIKGFADKAIDAIKGMFTGIKGWFDNILSSATTIFNKVKDAIMAPIDKAKDLVKGAVDTIKGFFDNLTLKLPDIKVPHFSLKNWSWNPVDWMTKMPSIEIDWYAKGGIMTRPTIFGMNGNSLMAGGEAGPEAILPLNEKTLGAIGKAIAKTMPGMNQQFIFNQPIQSPSEVARKVEQTQRQLAMGWNMK